MRTVIRRWRLLLLLALTIGLLAVAGSQAFADTNPKSEPGCPDSGAIAKLLQRPCIMHGNTPLRFEAFNEEWYLTYHYDGGLTGALDPNQIFNLGADTLAMVLVGIGVLVITLMEWAFLTNPVDLASKPLGDVITNLYANIYNPLFLIVISVGLGWVVWYAFFRQRATTAVQGIGWMILAVSVGGAFFAAPTQAMNWMSSAASSIAAPIMAGLGGLDPVEATQTDNFGKGDRSDAAVRASADRLWNTYVYIPWELAEFGTTKGDLANKELLVHAGKLNPDKFNADVKAAGATDWYNGKSAPARIVITFFAVVAIVLIAAMVIGLAVLKLVAGFRFLLWMAFSPFVLLIAIAPGRGREVFQRWIERVIAALLEVIIYSAVLAVVLLFGGVIADAAKDQSWVLATFLEIVVVAAAFVWRDELREVFTGATTSKGVGQHVRQLRTSESTQQILVGAHDRWDSFRGGRRQQEPATTGAAAGRGRESAMPAPSRRAGPFTLAAQRREEERRKGLQEGREQEMGRRSLPGAGWERSMPTLTGGNAPGLRGNQEPNRSGPSGSRTNGSRTNGSTPDGSRVNGSAPSGPRSNRSGGRDPRSLSEGRPFTRARLLREEEARRRRELERGGSDGKGGDGGPKTP